MPFGITLLILSFICYKFWELERVMKVRIKSMIPFGIILLILSFICYKFGGLERVLKVRIKSMMPFGITGLERVNGATIRVEESQFTVHGILLNI
jgi:hypothetical protein